MSPTSSTFLAALGALDVLPNYRIASPKQATITDHNKEKLHGSRPRPIPPTLRRL